jgi:hypothetical protein
MGCERFGEAEISEVAMTARLRSEDLIEVNDWSEVPSFTNEAEEAEFWRTHGLGRPLLDQMGPLDDVLPPPRLTKRRVTTFASDYARELPQQRPLGRRASGRGNVVVVQQRWSLAS